MNRIFATLAWLNGLALLLSSVLGCLYYFDHHSGASAPLPQEPLGVSWFMGHFVFGLFTVVFTLFVHCLIFTYFLGTGRWVKEVARAYGLPDHEGPRQTREFKRRSFPPALFAMLSAIATASSGAGAQTEIWPWWTHALLAVVTLLINVWAFAVEYRTVAANGIVMQHVVAQVNRKSHQKDAGSRAGK